MSFYKRLAVIAAVIALAIWLLQEFGGDAAAPPAPVATVTTTPAPQPTQAPAATPAPVVQQRATIPSYLTSAAAGSQVTIKGAQQSSDWWYITVVGRDRNALNDFLDQAMKMGLRDVDVNYNAYKQFVSNGQQFTQNTYKMRF